MRTLMLIAFAASLAAPVGLASASAATARCHDAKGKFTKCPAAAPAKPVKCKDAKGKFAKCSAPGAKPM